MKVLLVTDNPTRFPLDVPDVEVVAASAYLTDPRFSSMRGAKVFNLCRSYRYQTNGYYVSLLAAARRHRPLPAVSTIQDMRLQPVVRIVSQDLEQLIQRALRPLKSDEFQLSIYFGRNLAKRYDQLSLAIFNQFPAPLLRARFARRDRWTLENVRVIDAGEIPTSHRPFALEQAKRYFERPPRRRARRTARFELAILQDEQAELPPSNPRAIHRFVRAAAALDIRAELIGRESYGRLGDFDALFIRETTAVHHHTFRFARRATAEGLVVIDDPDSILKCTNKVYITELMEQHRISIPRTVIVSRDNSSLISEEIGFPCVLKQPDGSFSSGVVKVEAEEDLGARLEALFDESELLLAQEFVPTAFDWRVGVLDGRPLYVCRYHMARRHWQIVNRQGGRITEGAVDTIAVEDAPKRVVALAVRAAKLIGTGLYGVDVKEVRGRAMIIEINDNPSIDAGYEDRVLGAALYERIMGCFLERIEARRRENGA